MCYNRSAAALFKGGGKGLYMSENRAKYSSVPLQDMRKRPPNKAPSKPSAQIPGAPVNPRSFILLQVMLVAVLPLTFLAALLAKDQRLYWGFVILSLVCLGVMGLMKAFVSNARRVLTVIHAAMIAVSLFAILMTVPAVNDLTTPQTQDLASIFSDNTSASMVDMAQAQSQDQPAATASNPGAASQAQQKLDQFMSAWSNKDYAAMVSYSSPDWVSKHQDQRDAETDIFHLSAIRTPLDYRIQDVSGNDSDQTRTITMQATISKNDGKEPLLYNFQILMIRANSEWYVDPNSISSSQIVQQTAQVTVPPNQPAVIPAVSGSVLPQVRSDTVLYYNQDGGEFYHINPNCDSIGPKYKPLTATFYYRDVSSETFKNLKPCPVCKAPAR